MTLPRNRSVVVFCMSEQGHFQRLVPLIAGMSSRGATVHVLTHSRFERAVRTAGASFHDLFSRHSLDEADDASIPVPCRYVSFAACYAESVRHDVAALRPSLIVYDTFAVIGPVVAVLLGVPYVNVCAGHDVNPARFREVLARDPRVRVGPRCEQAAAILRDRHGIADASPFSYVSMLSPFLNICCEPPEFLDAGERRAFEPIAFFGSLPAFEPSVRPRLSANPAPRAGEGRSLHVLVSFGTVVWRSYAREAVSALKAIAGSLAEVGHARGLISLGRADVSAEDVAAMTKHNVRVEAYVDQARVLGETDLLVTHHGLNSTHEAILNRVPMVSYPFFWDQPALARRCRELDLAVPLTDSVRGPVAARDFADALAAIARERESLTTGLARACEWERNVIDARGAVFDRIASIG